MNLSYQSNGKIAYKRKWLLNSLGCKLAIGQINCLRYVICRRMAPEFMLGDQIIVDALQKHVPSSLVVAQDIIWLCSYYI